MKVTPNYTLPQFEDNDLFDKGILNDGFNKLDMAISDIQETFNNTASDGALVVAEVIGARGGEKDLETRLNNHSSQLETNVKYPPFPLLPVLCDGTNETSKIQAILNYAKENNKKEIKFPKGIYMLEHLDLWGKEFSGFKLKGEDGTIFEQILPDDRKIVGSYPTPSYARFQKADGIITIDSRTNSTTNSENSVKDITIEGITFLNNVANKGFDELSHQICCHGVDNITIKKCKFIGFIGDGIAITGGLDTNFTKAYNSNVTIKENFFNGINKDNRQAISIYYTDGYIVENNTIINVTRDNMPGAIDVEPDSDLTICKNGSIIKNKIKNCGGNVGAIAMIIKNSATVLQENFTISDNVIEDCNTPITILASTSPNAKNDNHITIDGNIVNNSTFLFRIEKVNGVKIQNNKFNNVTSSYYSLVGALNVDISKNTFKDVKSVDGLMIDENSDGVIIDGNTFINNGKNAITSNTKKIKSISNNTFLSSLGINALPLVIPVLTDLESQNIKLEGNNIDSSYINNINTMNLINNYVTYSIGTTPDKFPLGTTTFNVNGQHPLPSYTGSKAGNVEVIKRSTSMPQTTIMWYYSFDQTDGIYYRRGLTTTTWGSWYKLQGVAI